MSKVTRDAFLYLDGSIWNFAQCGSCWLFDGHFQRCKVLGSNFEVLAEDSCGYWGGGGRDLNVRNVKRFTPEEVGFVRHKVRCENCRYQASEYRCGFFAMLNEALPDEFDLDEHIVPRGCCNAQKPK